MKTLFFLLLVSQIFLGYEMFSAEWKMNDVLKEVKYLQNKTVIPKPKIATSTIMTFPPLDKNAKVFTDTGNKGRTRCGTFEGSYYCEKEVKTK
ncbi:MAG: hypothetical protein WC764_04295 [Candidatus Paceibacterota bacterium]|jgi:hypothetical protein